MIPSLEDEEILAILGLKAGFTLKPGEDLVMTQPKPGCFVFVREDRPDEAVPICLSAALRIHGLPEPVRAHMDGFPDEQITLVVVDGFGSPGSIELRPPSAVKYFQMHQLPVGTKATVMYPGGAEYIAFSHHRFASISEVGIPLFEEALARKAVPT